MRQAWLIGTLAFVGFVGGAYGQEPVKVVNLEKLNTAADEEDPFPAADGLYLLFARKGKTHYEIFQSARGTATAAFGPGKVAVTFPDADVRTPFLAQGKTYFATNEIVDEKLAKLKNFDIKWRLGSTATLFLPGVASAEDEVAPWIALGGKEIYFSRKTKDGWKVFVSNGPTPGPVGAGKDVGLAANFQRATLSPSGLTMFVQGPVKGERIGLYRSKRAKVGAAWSGPEPLTMLNSTEGKRGDMQPALSADGSRLYFTSDRPGGKGGLDLWVAPTSLLK